MATKAQSLSPFETKCLNAIQLLIRERDRIFHQIPKNRDKTKDADGIRKKPK